jgi:hypothetical protein
LADARRLPAVVALAAVVVAGVVVGSHETSHTSSAEAQVQPSGVTPEMALSTSWFCAGATGWPGSVAAGELVFDNAKSQPVVGTVQLVSPGGYSTKMSVSVPAGGTSTLVERFPGLRGQAATAWVGAIVTLYGGMASVNQVIDTPEGSASQPCASAASTRWYFVDGATLRNASDHISLLNPYPVDAIADLSFTTNQGQETSSAFEGVVVPADGLTVLNLGSHLRIRQHIAVTVSARTGSIVAFQTELVSQAPKGADFIGPKGGLNPAAAVPGATVNLGATHSSTSSWWPEGADGSGLDESYLVYNPGPNAARLSLSLVAQGVSNQAGSSSQLTVGPYGTASVTTNGQPWSLPGVAYAVHLASTNGVPVVAERSLVASAPSADRGLAVLLGQAQPVTDWLAAGASAMAPTKKRGEVWLEVADPGRAAAVVSVEVLAGRGLAQAAGTSELRVAAGSRAGVELPAGMAHDALIVKSSQPVLVEEDSWASRKTTGINLAPAVPLGSS